ncbi:hypothetical protein QTP70_034449, partial [Hemibagrus guttatus]
MKKPDESLIKVHLAGKSRKKEKREREMNGSAHSSPSALEFQLRRGPAGLGFNIVGGVDQQYVMNDSGIYVAKIKEDGAAALDGRLQEGDKILAINGHKLENLRHSAAVELFRSAGEEVTLLIQQR